jgi:transcriptional regulator with XRE-family HTH domain
MKLLRRQLNLSQAAFGKRLGITGAGISKIESGQRSLTEQMIILICKEFNINEPWLRYGKGEIFKEKLPFGMEQLTAYYQLDEFDVKIINEFLLLDEKKRKVIKDYIINVAFAKPDVNILSDGELKNEVPRCAEEADMTDEKRYQ